MQAFDMPEQSVPPAYTAPADLEFFRRHPDRRYRARKPFRSELRQLGTVKPLQPAQSHIVIVSRLGAGHIMTGLYAVRLGPRGRLPQTDNEIHKAFTRRSTANQHDEAI